MTPDPAWSFDPPRGPGDGEILVVGDTNLMGRADPASAFRHVAATFAAADARLAQMEGLIVADPGARFASGSDPLPYKPGWRHSGPETAAAYASAFSAVACASNVAYPPEACADTAARLAAAGLPACGIGADEDAARAPAIVETQAARIGLLSYTSVFHPSLLPAGPGRPGCAVLPARTAYLPGRRALEMPGAPPEIRTWPEPEAVEVLRADVAALRPRVDVLIVSCHWGLTGAERPVAYQTALAETAAAAGADLVFGHHPHVVQGAANVAGMPVFYSLGNFAFDNPRMIGRHRDGLLLRLLVRDRRIAAIAIVPVQRDAENDVRLLPPQDGEGLRILEAFRSRSAALGQGVALGPRGARLG